MCDAVPSTGHRTCPPGDPAARTISLRYLSLSLTALVLYLFFLFLLHRLVLQRSAGAPCSPCATHRPQQASRNQPPVTSNLRLLRVGPSREKPHAIVRYWPLPSHQLQHPAVLIVHWVPTAARGATCDREALRSTVLRIPAFQLCGRGHARCARQPPGSFLQKGRRWRTGLAMRRRGGCKQ